MSRFTCFALGWVAGSVVMKALTVFFAPAGPSPLTEIQTGEVKRDGVVVKKEYRLLKLEGVSLEITREVDAQGRERIFIWGVK